MDIAVPPQLKSYAFANGPDQVDVEVGLAVRRMRKARKLSQSDLGVAVGVTFQQIQKYERGANRISCSMLVKISKTLAVKAQDLLPPDDAPEPPSFLHQYSTVRGVEEIVEIYTSLPNKMRRLILHFAQEIKAQVVDV